MDIPKELADFTLIAGIGDYDQHKACVMSLAVAMDRLRKGEPIGEATDNVHCVCPVLRRLVIYRNDGPWESDAARTEWGLAMAPRLLDTRRDETETVRRGYRCADVAVRVIAAQALRSAGLVDLAVRLEALDPIIDKKSAAAARAASAAAASYAARAAAAAAAWGAIDGLINEFANPVEAK